MYWHVIETVGAVILQYESTAHASAKLIEFMKTKLTFHLHKYNISGIKVMR
jgi:hypothetical protein